MEVLTKFIEKTKEKKIKIAVVGDLLFDKYFLVRVNRISPEFPIPVLLSENDEPINTVPGGAANVCYQMKNWNADAFLISVLGSNFDPVVFKDIDYKYSTYINNWKIPIKKRLYDGDFPLDRWDIEVNENKTDTPEWIKARDDVFRNLKKLVETVDLDIVILSDYGKGVFRNGLAQDIIKFCNEKGIPTLVDPKTVNKHLWEDCTILKPNAGWAKAFCDKYGCLYNGTNEELGFIEKYLRCSVVLTDSGNGVGTISLGGEAEFNSSPYLSKKRPIIRSTIGAGDCFLAFFAIAYSLGFNLQEASKIAFNGSTAYIEDKHNSPVSQYTFKKWFDPLGAKKTPQEELIKIMAQIPNQTWIWTNGCFDLTHPGHLKTFSEAKKLGDKLIVGLNTDKSVKILKGDKRPILSYSEREEQLSHLQLVDFIVPVEEERPYNVIKVVNPNKIVKGGDYQVKEVSGWDIVGEENVHIIPLLPNVSTTKIIESIKNG